MAKGAFKSVRCHRGLSRNGCQKGDRCLFRHHGDNPKAIANEVGLVRIRIYTKLFDDGYSLLPQILYEIGKITIEQLHAAFEARARHQESLDEQAMHEQAARAQRPRMTITRARREVVRMSVIVLPRTRSAGVLRTMTTSWDLVRVRARAAARS